MQLCLKVDFLSTLVVYLSLTWFSHAESKRQCRNSQIDIMSSAAVKIEPVSISRVVLPRLSKTFSSDGHKLTFEFKTTKPSGLLFYGKQPGHPRTRLIALQMVDGMLFFTIRCPSADVELRLPLRARIDDGEWHSIEFRRRGRKGYITLDGKPYFRRYPATCRLTSFVFGGLDQVDNYALTPILRLGGYGHFDGCMRGLHLNLDLKSLPKYYAVSSCS